MKEERDQRGRKGRRLDWRWASVQLIEWCVARKINKRSWERARSSRLSTHVLLVAAGRSGGVTPHR